MFDIHSHLIPGVDDGPKDYDESLRVMEAAVNEGITHMIVTPHHHNGLWDNEKEDVIPKVQKLQQLADEHQLPLTLRPSQEVQITPNLLDELDQNRYLSLDPAGRYYLIEFPWGSFPDYAEDYLNELINRGITPIIAHPERQAGLYRNKKRLRRLVDNGCLIQVTNGSIARAFGLTAYEEAMELLKQDLVHVIASDTHDSVERPLYYTEAIAVIRDYFGQGKVDQLLDNSRKIYYSQPV